MLVKATSIGYWDLKRRRPGDVFRLNDQAEFSPKWMEELEEEEEEAPRRRVEQPRKPVPMSKIKAKDVEPAQATGDAEVI